MTSRMAQIDRDNMLQRARTARECVLRLLDAVEGEPFEIGVIGSLATGRFNVHSDIDLLVRGQVDTRTRVRIERLVAEALRGFGLPYDLIFAADLSPDRLKEFEHDLVESSSVRKAWSEAHADAEGTRQAR